MQQLNIESLPLPKGPGDKQLWAGLSGSSLGLALAQSATQFQGLTLIVTENNHQAARLHDEMSFFAAGEGPQITEFPDWETLPYDNFSPHQDIISNRLETLSSLPDITQGVLILSVTTLLHRLPPRSYIDANSLMLGIGETFSIKDMREKLEAAGYMRADAVYEHGEFAVRGSIMDVYPMGSRLPYRIELFDDEIESLRSFDPETQLSREKVKEIRLLPGKEFPLDAAGITQFRQRFLESFDIDIRRCPLYQDISQGFAAPGIEYYLPLFFEHQETLFDYLPEQVLISVIGDVEHSATQFLRDAKARYEDRCVDPQRPILPPGDLFLNVDEIFSHFSRFPRVDCRLSSSDVAKTKYEAASLPFPELGVEHKRQQPLGRLQHFLQENENTPVLFVADSAGRRETLLDLLATVNIRPDTLPDWQTFYRQRPQLGITVASLETGLWLKSPSLIVIAESQLFTHHVSQPRRRGKFSDDTDFIVKSLTELHPGAPVVHIDHGIGRYRGLETFDIDNQQTEFLILEYADAAKLYVPVSSLHLISRYSGADAESAPLHKLGSDIWLRAKRKAAQKIIDVAAELLDVYARREAQQGIQFKAPNADYQLFAGGFPFEETEDQEQAIQAVIRDMTSARAMDRLICGDVGFGKTEVAMRAAFIAVQNACQVAVLVPTTLLAQQHFDNFKDRFADWPVNIELISRFVSETRQTEILKSLADGKVDIIIGTHKLLQSSIAYKRLGVLVIDEEHRFGVRQKEQLKAMRSSVDILTLTATPIPRTLNMSMAGMRDLSIIATAPARRLSVKTFVRQTDKNLIKEAILRELLRGGQVFYLHNEVKTIERTVEEIAKLVPEARVCAAHGQLRERVLEKVMSDFYHKRHNVLVCSTIIETGIDIPSANTIIIDRADRFGLAQLHQLRGRVGRSHHQAYAYLLIPHPKALSADALKRIEAIQAADTLGAGFTLASHDLEIRGAGELLGEEQSGHIQTIGFSLYHEMLEQTVKVMKEGKQPNIDKPLRENSDINLRVPALIPDSYLPDIHTRLLMYKRIASASSDDDLIELKVEMTDRFGLLPPPIRSLFDVTRIKLDAEALGILKIEANAANGKITFKSDTVVDPYVIVKLVQDQPEIFSLHGGTELRFKHQLEGGPERIGFVEQIMKRLAPKKGQEA